MNQFSYMAHSGHVHPEKVDAVMTIPPAYLLVALIAIVGSIVAVAVLTSRTEPGKRTVVPGSRKK